MPNDNSSTLHVHSQFATNTYTPQVFILESNPISAVSPAPSKPKTETCRPVTLLALPGELLATIIDDFALPPLLHTSKPTFDHESKRTLQAVRLTSSLLNHIATPLLFETLVLGINDPSAAALSAIASSDPAQTSGACASVAQHVKTVCINLDCYYKQMARNKSNFINFQAVILGEKLDKVAFAHGMRRVSSYGSIMAEIDEMSDGQAKTQLRDSFSAWCLIMSWWDPYTPPYIPDPPDGYAKSSEELGLQRSAYEDAMERGFKAYGRQCKAQGRLIRGGTKGIFCRKLQAALCKMPLVTNAIFCDSSVLDTSPFDDGQLLIHSHELLAQHLQRPHPWDNLRLIARALGIFCDNNYAISTAPCLVNMPIIMSRAHVRLNALELRLFPLDQYHCDQLQRKPRVWRQFEAAMRSLTHFSINSSKYRSIFKQEYNSHYHSWLDKVVQSRHSRAPTPKFKGPTNQFALQYVASMLSGSRLQHLRLNEDAIRLLVGPTDDSIKVDLTPAKATLARLRSLRVENTGASADEMETFVRLLGPDLRKLELVDIVFFEGDFSETLRLLRDLVVATPDSHSESRRSSSRTCEVRLRDWAARDLMRDPVPLHRRNVYPKLSTSRAKRYIMGQGIEMSPVSLLDEVPWSPVREKSFE